MIMHFYIMNGGIFDQEFILLRDIRASIIRSPGIPDGEFVELKHVEHAHVGHAAPEQLWALQHARAHEKPAV